MDMQSSSTMKCGSESTLKDENCVNLAVGVGKNETEYSFRLQNAAVTSLIQNGGSENDQIGLDFTQKNGSSRATDGEKNCMSLERNKIVRKSSTASANKLSTLQANLIESKPPSDYFVQRKASQV